MAQGFSLATATAETFQPLVDSDFGVRPDDSSEDAGQLTLAGVHLSNTPGAGKRNPFSLFFKGRADFPLGQGTYFLNHATLGTFPLFIVPIADDATTREYQAVFS
jgi:hypothetical protein